MSWKDLRIAKKLYIGFGSLVVLAIVIAYLGWDGLGTVARRVEIADDASRLIRIADECSIAEKNYEIHKEEKYAEELRTLIVEEQELANEIKTKLEDPAHIVAINKALADLNTYETACEGWIVANQQGNAALAEMVIAGRQCETECENVRASQKEQMAQEFVSRADHQKLEERVDKADAVNRMLEWTLQMRRHEKNYVLLKDEQYTEKINQFLNQLKEQTQTTKSMMTRQENRDQMDAVVAGAENYGVAFGAYQAAFHDLTAQEEVLVEAAENVIAACEELYAGQKTKMEDAENSAVMLLVAFTAIAFVVALVLAFIIARGISKPVSQIAQATNAIVKEGDIDQNIELVSKDEIGAVAESVRGLIDYMKELTGAAESIAANDLTVQIEPKSEKDVLGKSLKAMVTNLIGMVRKLGENATQLVSAATEIASTSEQMSRGSKDQSEQVAQISTAVEEMSATIVESSKNAGDATDGSKKASETAEDGGKVINETIEGMNRIAGVVRESSDNINKLAASADQIGEIIGVIDDVADQTNLLALNAAIEAARAGEQGRGFAVVADEVRKLAERTAKATGEITDMIKALQQGTQDSVASMEAGTKEVDAGRELADKAGTSLTEIVNGSQRVMDMIQQIATATEEQSTAAEQISKNVENVASVAKESATGAEQAAAAAEELNRNAEGLKQIVAQFKVNEGSRELETQSAE